MKELYKYINEKWQPPVKAFTIIKPGFTQYENEIKQYIINKGFSIYKCTPPIRMTDIQAHKLYKIHKDEDWYDDLCQYMISGDIIATWWIFDHDWHPGVNTISLMKDIKHHFRDKYGIDEMRNCMHSSDSLDNVMNEGKLFFNIKYKNINI